MRRLLLTVLPKWLMSRCVRVLAAIPLPRFLRAPLHRSFARATGADLSEVAGALADYPSLAAFFRRPLRDGVRPVASTALVWPCDGTISSAGAVRGGVLEQVKGHSYAIADLLGGDEALARAFEGGTHATIYLAPRDYHRVHSPVDASLRSLRPLPGGLFPVNPQTARVIPQLFARNERCVFHLELPDGRPCAVVMVAALNVSDIRPSAAPGAALRRGAELGVFGLGSTTVVLLPPGELAFPALPVGTKVQIGASAAGTPSR
ncbi:MAG: phosphatidylserine decarboxylase [Planctomycetes bacterium]|nr:phosphatidylserine decarboxylase [Planctomycetota bacterium]